MTASNIIERLIDENKISGEEAYILIKAIIKKDNYITNIPSTGITVNPPYKPIDVWYSTNS